MTKNEFNFCKAFAEKVVGKKGIENKTRYLLEDFFFDEGWASRTNPNEKKEGYSPQLTYNEDTIKHFIEDFVRLFQKEWDDEWNKVIKEAAKLEKPKECFVTK